jgi:FkbM family methyltransferase
MTLGPRTVWNRVRRKLGNRREGGIVGKLRQIKRQVAEVYSGRGSALAGIERQVASLSEQLQRAASQDALKTIEEQLAITSDRVTYAVVRDVGLTVYCGFPVYMFRHDLYFTTYMKDLGEGHPHRNLSLAEARDLVKQREDARMVLTPSEIITAYWRVQNIYDYNAIHLPLLGCLYEAGLKPDFVDVGANIGDTAMSAAESLLKIGANSHVHSFEPGPVFELTRANIALNRLADRITVHNVAATDEPGWLPMQIMARHSECGSVAGISSHHPSLPVAETRFVRAARLDDALPNDGRSYYLKIDAEGADFAVVRGAARLIKSGHAPVIHLEFAPGYAAVQDMETLQELLKTHALFNLRRVDENAAFDRFDLIPPEEVSRYRDEVAASPQGWCDVALVAHNILDTTLVKAFLEAYRASGR